MDDPRVITVPISRNDRFYFTRKYDSAAIAPLLAAANVLNRTIKDIPILPEWAAKLDEELIRRSIFGTAAIEGNPLTEDEVEKILSSGEKKNVTERTELEVENLKLAYDFVKSLTSQDPSLSISEELIQKIHEMITSGIDNEHTTPGKYRHEERKVGDKDHGGTYVPPKFYKDISLLMREFCGWMNSDEMKREFPVIRTAEAHYHLAMIHPFFDGNGRTARLVEALLLQMSGFKFTPVMLSNYYYRNIHDYYRAFSLSQKHPEKEITPFLEFVLKGLIESSEDIRTRIFFSIRILSLKDYYAFLRKGKSINLRQHDLLTMLLDKQSQTKFTITDFHSTTPFNVLYRGRSERTVARDVKKLLDLNLVKSEEPGLYELNFGVL